MNDNKPKPDKTSFAIIGFACGVLTVILVVLALKGC
jgi:tetrahydromethanopterin S-methyltransferase subunit F